MAADPVTDGADWFVVPDAHGSHAREAFDFSFKHDGEPARSGPADSAPDAVGDDAGTAMQQMICQFPALLLDLTGFLRLIERHVREAFPVTRCRLTAFEIDERAEGGSAIGITPSATSWPAGGRRRRARALSRPSDRMSVLPIALGGRLLGELAVEGAEGALGVGAVELARLRAAVDRLAPFLDVALCHEAIAREADTDGLTRLANHRAFYRALERELSIREGTTPVSVLLFDIDGLKLVNDTAGHLAGDALLRQFARMLEAQVRADDLVARYGGDEFAVVLPELDADHASMIGKRVRRALRKRSLTSPRLRPAAVTFGVATAPLDGRDAAELVAAADRRLYAARGRRLDVPRGMALGQD